MRGTEQDLAWRGALIVSGYEIANGKYHPEYVPGSRSNVLYLLYRTENPGSLATDRWTTDDLSRERGGVNTLVDGTNNNRGIGIDGLNRNNVCQNIYYSGLKNEHTRPDQSEIHRVIAWSLLLRSNVGFEMMF